MKSLMDILAESDMYPTSQQMGLKPIAPLPAPARPPRPFKPLKPSKGPKQKTVMKTPWNRQVTVNRDLVPQKQAKGYIPVRNITKPPTGLASKYTHASKSATGKPVSSLGRKPRYTFAKEGLSLATILNKVLKEVINENQ